MDNFLILKTTKQLDYELLDSGDNEKLERFGQYILRRPDPQALWKKNLSIKDWEKADAFFFGQRDKSGWIFRKDLPKTWSIKLDIWNFEIHLGKFKHTGIFPEQLNNWLWLKSQVAKIKRPISILNLFGYTGAASLACAAENSTVCHVDGSKVAIAWGKTNAKLSKLQNYKIRWINDDVLTFVKREIRRGNKYDGIIMDPPAFGHGPKKELWKIEKHFTELLDDCRKILSPKPVFFLINGYAAGYSAIAYENNLKDLLKNFGGTFEKGELTIEESKSKRLLPAGIFARWQV